VQSVLDACNTLVEDEQEVRNALDWYGLGADFADALHLRHVAPPIMHTFDRSFCRGAREAGIAPLIRCWRCSEAVSRPGLS